MPTREELKKAERGDLIKAIVKHKGQQSVAEKLGLTYSKKRGGYWADFNLQKEILSFIEKHGIPGGIPTDKELEKADRGDLVGAIRKNGGQQSVGERLGMASVKKRNHYWNDFTKMTQEIHRFNEKHRISGRMPTDEELKKGNQGDLASALSRHGGQQIIAERLGLAYSKKRKGYWEDFVNIERELLAFIEQRGTPGVMPTQIELFKAGLGSLNVAIQKHRGLLAVAERLKLKLAYTAKRAGYWDDFTNLARELLTFIKEYGTHNVMPSQQELMEATRSDLVNAIRRHGGQYFVAPPSWSYLYSQAGRVLG